MKMSTLIVAIGLLVALVTLSCDTARPSTTNTAALADLDFGFNTGQNFQIWEDGSVQTGATQLDSGVISPDTTNWQGTAVSSIMALNKNGV